MEKEEGRRRGPWLGRAQPQRERERGEKNDWFRCLKLGSQARARREGFRAGSEDWGGIWREQRSCMPSWSGSWRGNFPEQFRVLRITMGFEPGQGGKSISPRHGNESLGLSVSWWFFYRSLRKARSLKGPWSVRSLASMSGWLGVCWIWNGECVAVLHNCSSTCNSMKSLAQSTPKPRAFLNWAHVGWLHDSRPQRQGPKKIK